jgi:hypothetical protein
MNNNTVSEPKFQPIVKKIQNYYIYRQIYLLTVIGLTPGGSSTVHIYTQTILILIYLLTAIGLTPGGSSTVHFHLHTNNIDIDIFVNCIWADTRWQ